MSAADSMHARKPFISVVPRPYKRSLSRVSLKGDLVQFCPVIGTTSVCPEKITPPSTFGPKRAIKPAFSLFLLKKQRVTAPRAAQKSFRYLIKFKLDFDETVSNSTNFSSVSKVSDIYKVPNSSFEEEKLVFFNSSKFFISKNFLNIRAVLRHLRIY